MGSPAYMSPEQARGDLNIDARTDVWAFGIVYFEALTGALPFPGTTPYAMACGRAAVPSRGYADGTCMTPAGLPMELAPVTDLPRRTCRTTGRLRGMGKKQYGFSRLRGGS